MATKFKIHPAIGIARLGNSPEGFYLAPEGPGHLPIACDANGITTAVGGKEPTITSFRDDAELLCRQGARFRVYRYDDGPGSEVAIDEPIDLVFWKSGQHIRGVVRDIEWTAYVANKKSIWYEFQETDGEHGYAPDHPLRNADVTDTSQRRRMIIDPGPQMVSGASPRASFARVDNPVMSQSFPPPLSPCSITTLGDLLATVQPVTDTAGVTTKHARLVVLGGHGNSGSYKTGPGEPKITRFANNDGWFDDEADGYVNATLKVEITTIDGTAPVVQPGGAKHLLSIPVDSPAWVIIGYPRFAPQILDMITMDETMYDLFVRTMAHDLDLHGVPPFDGTQTPPKTPEELSVWQTKARWNSSYHPRFWRDIWPILKRPDQFKWVMDFDSFVGGDPHSTTSRGNLDPSVLSVAPYEGQDPVERKRNEAKRRFIYGVLRQPGQENLYTLPGGLPRNPGFRLPGMPLLCGDNPLSNTVPSKFLRLTETMLFLLKQWAEGKFIDEKAEHLPLPDDGGAPKSGVDLDRGVLSNLLGGSFCPGAETTWIVRNPAVYAEPYRIKQSSTLILGSLAQTDNLTAGLEPGDLTKRNAVPWQADFNECATQPIDITYEDWNASYPGSIGVAVKPVTQTIYWWPAHRPMEVNTAQGQISWSGNIPVAPTGDFTMVTAWKNMGFVADFSVGSPDDPGYLLIEGWNSIPPIKISKGS